MFEYAWPARPSHTGFEWSDRHGSEVGQKNDKCFFKTRLPKVLGRNLVPPYNFLKLFGPLRSLKCLLSEDAWLC